MYGHLLLVIEHGIVKQFGTKVWEEIKKKVGIKESIIDTNKYDEIDFEKLLKIASNICNINYDTLLNKLGDSYIEKLQIAGNYQLIRLLGRSMHDFIQNIDFVHTIALAKYPDADIPLFRLEYDDYSTNNDFKIHYYTKKKNSTKFVESLLKTISSIFFKKKLKIEIILQEIREGRTHIVYSINLSDLPQETVEVPTLVAQTKKNAEKQIEYKNIEEQKEKIDFIRKEYGESALPVQRARNANNKWKAAIQMNILYKKLNPTIPRTLSIGPRDFCEVFPYHIVFDQAMCLKQSGIHIQSIIPEFRKEGTNITSYLKLKHPSHNKFTFSNILDMLDCPHIVMVVNNSLVTDDKYKDQLYFRGEMIKLSDTNLMLYLCSPLISNLDHVDTSCMRMSEIRNHDVTKYFVSYSAMSQGDWANEYLGQTNSGQNNNQENNKNNDKPNNLNSNNDKAGFYGNGNMLVVPMNNNMGGLGLVQKVVRDGKKYKNCGILFCDIVQFSTLVDSTSPSELIEMLNKLHDSFDRLIMSHGVDRIDVVGDAYLVVSGIPQSTKKYAERIGNCALAMLLVSKSIPSPYDYGKPFGKRCLIRIGIHCGDVIGGIVGSQTPRFTVMGDSVVTASRLESHGVPDEIHLSSTAFREMSNFHFEIQERGLVEIRGKGRQYTYLLKKNIDLSNAALLGQTNQNIYME